MGTFILGLLVGGILVFKFRVAVVEMATEAKTKIKKVIKDIVKDV